MTNENPSIVINEDLKNYIDERIKDHINQHITQHNKVRSSELERFSNNDLDLETATLDEIATEIGKTEITIILLKNKMNSLIDARDIKLDSLTESRLRGYRHTRFSRMRGRDECDERDDLYIR